MATQLTARGTSLIATDDEAPIPVSTSYLAVLVVSAILLLAHLPMLISLARELWRREHYQFFPFLIPASLFLGYVGLKRLSGPVHAGNQILSIGLVFLAGLTLILSSLVGSGTLAAIATLITLSAAIYGVGGWTLYKALLPSLIILLPAIPPPFKSDEAIIVGLQRWVAAANGKVLDYLGVLHYRDGINIHIPGHSLGVEEACSGIHSFFALMTLTLFLLLLYRRIGDSGRLPPLAGEKVGFFRRLGRGVTRVIRPGVLHPILLLVFAVYWVLFGNFLRILICVISQYYFGYNLATNDEGDISLEHQALSMGMFALAAILVFSTDRLLLFFSPKSARKAEDVIPRDAPWTRSPLEVVPDLNRSWLSSWAIGVVFAFVATLEFWVVGKEIASTFNRPDLRIAMVGENALKSEVGKAQRVPGTYMVETRSVANINGEFSQMWMYKFNSTHNCKVSLDYTFTGWHDLTQCYLNSGWTMQSKRIEKSRKNPNDEFVVAEFTTNRNGQPLKGMLLFSLFDGKGERIQPPTTRTEKLFRERIDAVWNRLFGSTSNRATAPTYQVQVFIDSRAGLSPEEEAWAIDFFNSIEEELKAAVQQKLTEQPKEELKEKFKEAMKVKVTAVETKNP